MPKVNIKNEIFEELKGSSSDVSEKVNDIVKSYLSAKRVHSDSRLTDSLYRDYFLHGNGD